MTPIDSGPHAHATSLFFFYHPSADLLLHVNTICARRREWGRFDFSVVADSVPYMALCSGKI